MLVDGLTEQEEIELLRSCLEHAGLGVWYNARVAFTEANQSKWEPLLNELPSEKLLTVWQTAPLLRKKVAHFLAKRLSEADHRERSRLARLFQDEIRSLVYPTPTPTSSYGTTFGSYLTPASFLIDPCDSTVAPLLPHIHLFTPDWITLILDKHPGRPWGLISFYVFPNCVEIYDHTRVSPEAIGCIFANIQGRESQSSESWKQDFDAAFFSENIGNASEGKYRHLQEQAPNYLDQPLLGSFLAHINEMCKDHTWFCHDSPDEQLAQEALG
jgi:hypothetical protein